LAVLYSSSNKTPETTTASNQPVTEPAPATAAPVPQPVEPAKPVKATTKSPASGASGGEVVRKVLPDVPRSAQNTIRGTIKVLVRVQVDPSGKVTSAKFKTRGSSRYFADRALKAAQQWEFSAPHTDGQPTPSTWLLQFRFNRKSIQATPQRVKG
jgi:TonB family protein